MPRVEFWEMPLREFFLKLHYYFENETRRFREQAELVRLQTVTLVNIQLATKDRIKDARRLWKFPWENEQRNEMKEKNDKKTSLKALVAMATNAFGRTERKEAGDERNQ